MHGAQQPPFATTAIIYAVAIALLVWRMARPQRTSVTRLWFMPIVLLTLTAFSIWSSMYASALAGQAPPTIVQIGPYLLIGAALGIPLGFLRGHHSDVKPAGPGVMYVHSSPVIIMVWLAAFLARAAMRALLPHAGAGTFLAGDALLAFAMAALITSYYAIYQKYRAALQQVPAT